MTPFPTETTCSSFAPASKARIPILRVSDVSAGYHNRRVLRHVGLTLHAGECLALLGPNGSGKTTLLRALSGVLPLLDGKVELLGRPLAGMRARDRARSVAVVPQRGNYPPRVTAKQFVLLGRFAHLSWLGVYERADHMAADMALEATGTMALAHRHMQELSGGEVQRVLLARALAQETPLLLLDELAAGLDMARMVELFDLLERRRAAGTCVLMVMHDCNLAAIYATRLMGLREGRVLFDGPVDDVFTEVNLNALYSFPVVVLPHPLLGRPQALVGRASAWSTGPYARAVRPAPVPAAPGANSRQC
ncbi:MAG: ABC transporter ATP-binding protein [Desulfovibrio sp.]|nr:ABC transporter ATP-binding protein [Desulfovibrio sp.]